ncbi:MAG: FAD-binding oxidoreductase [Luminiphilus sp.]|nr:FAD-binding oxidoreductase [Luminiphilus sp.]
MATLPTAMADALLHRLGPAGFPTEPDALENFGRDWTRFTAPAPAGVALPASVEDVKAIIQLARDHGIAIVPSGGRTGLSGGAMAADGELVLSLARMNKILHVDPVNRSLTCEAGAVTAAIQAAASEQGLMYPVDFASSGSSQIGGNIATNAGGIQVIRYGMTRNWVTGLKVVTGTSELLDLNRGLVKNNTGLDLRHLMIGSEGILGIVVEATLALTKPPANPRVMVIGVPSMSAIMAILEHCQAELPVLAFEFFSDLALDKVIAQHGLPQPLQDRYPFYALVEFEEASADTDIQLAQLIERCMAAGWVEDAVLSHNESQRRALWRLREDISETIARWTPYKNDISTTVSNVPLLLERVESLVATHYADLEVVWYGHIGDGNLHLNILKPEDISVSAFQDRCKSVSEQLFTLLEDLGGSISAEHGVGLLKKDFLRFSRSEQEIALMRGIKRQFDPDGILNPGKVFDPM